MEIATDGISEADLQTAPAKLDDLKAEVQDPLIEVNLGTPEDPRPTYISALLEPKISRRFTIELLKEFTDCFAWDYHEMPGLDRSFVEHRLPRNKPYKQPPRRMTPELTAKVKEEIERLLKAGFFKPIRYAEWVSNLVPVINKNGMRVCVDFRNLNWVGYP